MASSTAAGRRRTLADPLGWQHSTVLTGDLAEAVAALKARHDEIHVIASLDLVQSLLRLRLVDRRRPLPGERSG